MKKEIFYEILDIEQLLVLLADGFTGILRTVFHDDDLEIFERLQGETLQKFGHFVGTVVYRNDYSVFHSKCFWK